jgi:syntaxin 7
MAAMVSPRGDKEELERVNRELKGIHFKAVTAYNRMKNDVSNILRTDESQYYSKVGGEAHTFGELAQEFRRVLEEHPGVKDAVSTQKIVRDFQNVLHRSELVMKTAKAKEQKRRQVEGDVSDREGVESSSGVQEMAALVDGRRIENQVQYNEALIEERDRAITEITGQIGEVHQIFQDLAVLVHDQGEMVDDIEANLTRASNKTHDAHTQLIRAERSQRRARSTWCFLAMLAGGAIGVLLLIVLV